LLALTATLWTVPPLFAQDTDRTLSANGVAYVSGGIGSDSRDALAVREKEFNFKLVSTIIGTGTYVSDVAITIADSSGKTLLRHTTQGPLFMARLPEAAYNLSVTFRDQTQTRKFRVPPASRGRLHTEYLRWPARADDDWTLPWNAP